MAETYFQVRVWTADNSRWRALPLKYVASARWRIAVEGGYAEATITLNGSLSDAPLSGVRRGVRIELMGKNPGDATWTRLYRGYVRYYQESEAPRGRQRATHRKQVECTCYGPFERLSRLMVRQRYALPDETDIAVAASRILSKWAVPKIPGLVVNSQPTGVYAEQIDGWRKTVGELLSGLLELSGGAVAVGVDVDPLDDVSDRAFFRPFGSAASPDHVWPIPAPPNASWALAEVQKASDERNIANVVDLRGGTPRFPNLLNPTSGFEYPTFNTAETGNMLVDPSFDNEDAAWVLIGGASFKSAGLSEGPTDSGEKMVELDSLGEIAAQDVAVVTPAIVLGNQHTAVARVRLGAGGDLGMEATLTLFFLDNVGAIISSVSRVIAPDEASWRTFTVDGFAPTGTVGVSWKIECTNDIGGPASLMVDNAAVYDSDKIIQPKVFTSDGGGNIIEATNWAHEDDDPHEGAYCLYVAVTITGVAIFDYVEVRHRIDSGPTGNQGLRFVVWVKNAPGAATVPDLDLVALALDGNLVVDTQTFNYPAASYPDWEPYKLEFNYPASGASGIIVLIRINETGSLLTDAWTLRDQASDENEYVEGQGAFEAVYRAEDLVGAGPVHDSNDDYGDVPALVDLDTVTTGAIGERHATAVVNSRATAIERPVLRMVGRAVEVWPGQYVRLVGNLGADVMPDPLPVAEVEGSWVGKIELTAYLNQPRPTETRVQRQIAREAARREGSHL